MASLHSGGEWHGLQWDSVARQTLLSVPEAGWIFMRVLGLSEHVPKRTRGNERTVVSPC